MIWGGYLSPPALRATALPMVEVDLQEPGTGCDECAAAGYRCLNGSTGVPSGMGRTVYPIVIVCPPNVCDECDEVADR